MHVFGIDLVEKLVWNLLMKHNLWSRLIESKYLASDNILSWIYRLYKYWKGGSSHWNAIVNSFLVVGYYLGLKVENGQEVRVGEDSIMGYGPKIKLFGGLMDFLRRQGSRTLKD